jgi:CheY-like chemotaxis protein/two-component sensor histidine kinase
MKTNKPSHEELLSLVNELMTELNKTNLLLDQAKKDVEEVRLKSSENKNTLAEQTDFFLHRIKAPLDTVVGLAKLLSASNLSLEEKTNLSGIIVNTATELQSTFTEFISYISLKRHVNELNIEVVSLNELFDELRIKFLDQLFFKNLNLRTSKELPDGYDTVFTDKKIISQIFSSLLSNSIKYTDTGYIEIGYQVLNSEIQFYVIDTGIGLEHFEKSVEKKQANIGLSTVKHLVELLHGSLKTESNSSTGTTVSFQIPYEPALGKIEKKAKKTIKVLIADDEEISFMILEKLMKKGDVEIIRAKNGEEAYAIYKKNPDINLILMDLRMPQVDGYVAAQLIKNEAPNIPIIAQSAYLLNEDKKNYANVFNGYLSKPINKKEFELAVTNYIDIALLN